MPPPNTSFATAIDLGTLPATVSIDVHDSGTNYNVYYKFTAPVGARVIGAWGFSPIAQTYRSTIKPYIGPAGAPTQILLIAAVNKPIQFPVTPGSEYFLEFTKNGNTSPATIAIDVLMATNNNVGRGDILVPDDTTGFPLAAISGVADDTYIAFIKDIAAGEAGCILHPNGPMAFEEVSNGHVKVYNLSFSQLTDLDFNVHDVRIRGCQGQNKFFVGENDGVNTKLYSISNTGVKSALLETLTGVPVIGIESLAGKNDGTILYYADKGTNVAIKRWDLVAHGALADLVAGTVNYNCPDILYLTDDTIIVLYYNSGTKDVVAKRYSTAGATLNTYSLGAQTASTKPRLAYALDNPNSFWVWTHNTSGRSIFRNVKCSDGSILTTRNHQEYEGGAYNATETATPITRFGHSFSCAFVIMGGMQGGIYFLSTGKRHDSFYGDIERKIPNPTIRTALIGE